MPPGCRDAKMPGCRNRYAIHDATIWNRNQFSDGDGRIARFNKAMPAMPNDVPRGSAVNNLITWVQIMETLAAASSAPVFMQLPESQLQCQGRQDLVMSAMSISPIVPEGWKYTSCGVLACEHCTGLPGVTAPTPADICITSGIRVAFFGVICISE